MTIVLYTYGLGIIPLGVRPVPIPLHEYNPESRGALLKIFHMLEYVPVSSGVDGYTSDCTTIRVPDISGVETQLLQEKDVSMT